MNNYCTNCGNKLNKGEANCTKCGFSVTNNKSNNQLSKSERRTAALVFSLDMILFCVVACFFFSGFSSEDVICGLFLLALIILVWLKVSYPSIEYIQVSFIAIVGVVGVILVLALLIIAVCFGTIYSCRGMY